ncbi:MAG: oligosaccharide flippase family protein [Pseudomonadota bacterium]|nr:oligosaccharide flippase family protein [Pseudomonadota bacterium]
MTDTSGLTRLRRLLAGRAPKLMRDLAVLTSGQFVTKLIAVGAFAFLARTLDPEGYGAVEYIVGLTALFAMAVDFGLGTIGVKRIAESRNELPTLAAQIPLARLGIALLAIPILIIVAAALGSPSIPLELVWLYAASLIFVACNQDWLLQSEELMAHVAFAHMLRVLTFTVAVLLLVQGSADVAAVGGAELAAAAVVTLYYLLVTHIKVTPLRVPHSAFGMMGLLRESASLGLSRFAWAAAQYMPLFLVGTLVGGAQVGWFAAAQRLVTSISTFSFVYHFNLYPALARVSAVSSSELTDLMRVSFRVTGWASIGLAFGLTLAASPIVTTIFGGRFEAAAPALTILVWVIPVTFVSGHARWALIVAGAQRHVLYSQIIGLVAIVLAGVPLVLLWNDVGAAVAGVTGAIAVWIVSHTYAMRLAAQPPGLMLLARPLLLAVILGMAVQSTAMMPLVQAIIGCTFFAAVAPFVDRSLLSDLMQLAHAKATVVQPRKTSVPPS